MLSYVVDDATIGLIFWYAINLIWIPLHVLSILVLYIYANIMLIYCVNIMLINSGNI